MALRDFYRKANILYAFATALNLASDHDVPAHLAIHCEGVAANK